MSLPGQVANSVEPPQHPPCRGFALVSTNERLEPPSVRDVVEAAAMRHRNCNSAFSKSDLPVPFSVSGLSDRVLAILSLDGVKICNSILQHSAPIFIMPVCRTRTRPVLILANRGSSRSVIAAPEPTPQLLLKRLLPVGVTGIWHQRCDRRMRLKSFAARDTGSGSGSRRGAATMRGDRGGPYSRSMGGPTYECHGTSPGNRSVPAGGMGEGAAKTAALNAGNGWIGIEMVRTLSRPLSQQQNPNRNRPIQKPGLGSSSKEMRLRLNVQECGTSCSITTITRQWILWCLS